MDQIIDIKSFEILNSSLAKSKGIQTIRLLTVFGNNGSEVIFATTSDKVYGFGQNKNGCLGLATTEQHIQKPRLNATLSGKGIKDIICGFEHCVGLTSDGKCYAWGHNDYGRLGIATYESVSTPLLIKELANQCIVQIACGLSHTLALTIRGQIYSWGRNNWGQLGIHHYKTRFFPNLVEIPSKVVEMSSGRNHSLVLTETKQVFVWGLNDCGQLGLHPASTRRSDEERPSSCNPHILSNFMKCTSVAKVVCGPNHSLILTTNGCIYAFGDNAYAQVGNTHLKQKYTPYRLANNRLKFKDIIANNQNHLSMAITDDNNCYVWGRTDPKVMTELSMTAHPIGRSVFDIYAKLVRFKITFKTVLINEDNNQLNEIKCKAVLKPNARSDANVDQLNGLLKKSFDSNKNGSNCRPIENERQNNENAFSSEEQKTKPLNNGTIDRNNTNSNEISNNSKEMSNFETNSVHSIDSDDYYSCSDTHYRGAAGLKFQGYLTESFNKPNISDLMFIFNDKRVIYCHKTILKIRNERFWKNCDKNLVNPSGNPMHLRHQIFIHSYPSEPFHRFLQYLYGFEIDLDNQVIDSVIRLAHIYEEQELIDLCYQYLQKTEGSLNLTNVCTLYEMAVKYELNKLKKFCIGFAAKNWKTICKSDAFQALNDSLCERFMTEVFAAKKVV